ncbi:hypothetical protein PUN28_014449 [Cardiocondyla obscurior]|uniref:Uncharacterized protein n=1 Tax=Cardiocondyla obscurior TaxID=286306 RepID=A0AAW2F087_9HYME
MMSVYTAGSSSAILLAPRLVPFARSVPSPPFSLSPVLFSHHESSVPTALLWPRAINRELLLSAIIFLTYEFNERIKSENFLQPFLRIGLHERENRNLQVVLKRNYNFYSLPSRGHSLAVSRYDSFRRGGPSHQR